MIFGGGDDGLRFDRGDATKAQQKMHDAALHLDHFVVDQLRSRHVPEMPRHLSGIEAEIRAESVRVQMAVSAIMKLAQTMRNDVYDVFGEDKYAGMNLVQKTSHFIDTGGVGKTFDAAADYHRNLPGGDFAAGLVMFGKGTVESTGTLLMAGSFSKEGAQARKQLVDTITQDPRKTFKDAIAWDVFKERGWQEWAGQVFPSVVFAVAGAAKVKTKPKADVDAPSTGRPGRADGSASRPDPGPHVIEPKPPSRAQVIATKLIRKWADDLATTMSMGATKVAQVVDNLIQVRAALRQIADKRAVVMAEYQKHLGERSDLHRRLEAVQQAIPDGMPVPQYIRVANERLATQIKHLMDTNNKRLAELEAARASLDAQKFEAFKRHGSESLEDIADLLELLK